MRNLINLILLAAVVDTSGCAVQESVKSASPETEIADAFTRIKTETGRAPADQDTYLEFLRQYKESEQQNPTHDAYSFIMSADASEVAYQKELAESVKVVVECVKARGNDIAPLALDMHIESCIGEKIIHNESRSVHNTTIADEASKELMPLAEQNWKNTKAAELEERYNNSMESLIE